MIQTSLGLILVVEMMHSELITRSIISNNFLDQNRLLRSFSLFCDLSKRCLLLSACEWRKTDCARIIKLFASIVTAWYRDRYNIAPPTYHSDTWWPESEPSCVNACVNCASTARWPGCMGRVLSGPCVNVILNTYILAMALRFILYSSVVQWLPNSLVPRPIPSFSMLHVEKREGLVHEITW